MRGLLAGVLLVMLGGCGGAAPQRQPELVERTAMVEAQGLGAMRDGDFAVARALFARVLQLQQSVDNLPGIATASINLATVYHRLHDDQMALRLLNAIIEEKHIPYPPPLRAEAAFRKAVILVDAGAPEAPAAITDAASRCGGSCGYVAGLDNLRARLALRKGDFPAALAAAQKAQDAAGNQDRQELANARRNIAAAAAGLGKLNDALTHYRAALALDKQLLHAGHIADDLAGASRVLKRLGRDAESVAYARRAAAVRDAISQKK